MTDTNASTQQLRAWVGRKLVDPGGGKIGSIEDIYLDDATGKPEWLAVKTGWFGHRVSFVPIVGASPGNGGDIVSRWDKSHVKDAPHAEPDGQLTVEEESELYRHYGIQYTPATGTAGDMGGMGGMGTAPATDQGQARAQMQAQDRGRAATAGTPDAEADVLRSEEELQIDKQQHEAGKVRLRKWVETEHVTRTVPVSHEEAHLRREPIGADEAAGMAEADMADSDTEVVLTEEEIVANKKVVPKERVRLEKETVTEEVPVEADLRRERVEVEGTGDRPTPPS